MRDPQRKGSASRCAFFFLAGAILLLAACSKSDPAAVAAPTFDEGTEAASTAPAAKDDDGSVEGQVQEKATSPPVESSGAEPSGADAPATVPESDGVSDPPALVLGEVDVQTLMPVLEDTVWRDPEYGYVPSESGETPIIDFQVPPPFRMTPVCYDSGTNDLGFFISTTEGILCGMEVMHFPEQAEQICSNRSPEGRVVELDPYLKLETLEGDVLVRTTGCAIPVTQEGLDRYVESLSETE